MAKPIKITPVLKGEDAINFYKRLEANKEKKVSKEYLATIRESAKSLQARLKKG